MNEIKCLPNFGEEENFIMQKISPTHPFNSWLRHFFDKQGFFL